MQEVTKVVSLVKGDPTSPLNWNSGLEVIKLFHAQLSAQHEIFSADRYENANNSWYFHIY